jgi:two-component system response regulator YesN
MTPPTPKNKLSLVLVDDHRMVADAMGEWLASLDTVQLGGVFSNGTSALAALLENPPDLVLLDQSMPGLSGLEVIRALRGKGSKSRCAMLTT